MKTKMKIICLMLALMSLVLLLSSCGGSSSSSSSSGGYRYGTKESYDSKYGAGSYDADKKLLDDMRNSWNNSH